MLVAPWSWVLFYIYVAVAVIVLLNLVTAVIVENAFKYSHLDEVEEITALEKERLASLEELKTLFECLDDDLSGDITWDEFEQGFSKPEIRMQMEKLEIGEDELKPLFDLLDSSGDGVLSLEVFFKGIQRCSGTATAKETFQISKRVEHLCSLVEDNNHVIHTAMKAGFQHHADETHYGRRRKVSSSASNSPLHQQEHESDNMKLPLIDSLREPHELSQSCVVSHLRDSEPVSRVASSIEDDIRRSLDDLAVQLDAITEDFRSQCKTMHYQVVEAFASTCGNSDPETKIFNHGTLWEANGSTSGNRSLAVDENAVAERFDENGDIMAQTVAPLTCLGTKLLAASAHRDRKRPAQPVTEHPCKGEIISKQAHITTSGPALPRQRLLQEPCKSASLVVQVPESIIQAKPRSARTVCSTLTSLSLPPAPNAPLDGSIDDSRISDDVLDEHHKYSA
eukprot:TRINITY_DN18653_c0_g2_i2.p1 TRINITY_DN18653_c0_g2~~TRINITY_DN18653_c0_g2_i2.p1  ORF type:complete len:479 (+),score=64.74 TRINITY_DN18653_c0_g2_i2:84-1439(+)